MDEGAGHRHGQPRRPSRRRLIAAIAAVALGAAAAVSFAVHPSLVSFRTHASRGPSGSVVSARAEAGPAPGTAFDSSSLAARPVAEQEALADPVRQADLILDDFNDAFFVQRGRSAYYRADQRGDRASFWQQAEMIEMVEDAYARSNRSLYKRMIAILYRGFITRFGSNWLGNDFNDDIAWMVIATERAYEITGDRAYLRQAKHAFDRMYSRAWSGDLGGGLWWTTDRSEKNACVNGPAAIAASLLYRSLHEKAYLRKARRIYSWLRASLFDPSTGAVSDHISRNGRVTRQPFTYNQGTLVGAAGLLYDITDRRSYFRDAVAALKFTRANLTNGGILRSEGAGGDGGGFKGIFARWAGRFVSQHRLTDYSNWLRQNAAAVARDAAQDRLVDEDWAREGGDAILYAFDCSSGVIVLQTSPATRPSRRHASPGIVAAGGQVPVP